MKLSQMTSSVSRGPAATLSVDCCSADKIALINSQGKDGMWRRKDGAVIPPSALSYLSADGGPPLSLKSCTQQSQGRDGWGESVPVA